MFPATRLLEHPEGLPVRLLHLRSVQRCVPEMDQ